MEPAAAMVASKASTKPPARHPSLRTFRCSRKLALKRVKRGKEKRETPPSKRRDRHLGPHQRAHSAAQRRIRLSCGRSISG